MIVDSDNSFRLCGFWHG